MFSEIKKVEDNKDKFFLKDGDSFFSIHSNSYYIEVITDKHVPYCYPSHFFRDQAGYQILNDNNIHSETFSDIYCLFLVEDNEYTGFKFISKDRDILLPFVLSVDW